MTGYNIYWHILKDRETFFLKKNPFNAGFLSPRFFFCVILIDILLNTSLCSTDKCWSVKINCVYNVHNSSCKCKRQNYAIKEIIPLSMISQVINTVLPVFDFTAIPYQPICDTLVQGLIFNWSIIYSRKYYKGKVVWPICPFQSHQFSWFYTSSISCNTL